MNFKTKNSLLSKLDFFDVMYKPRKQSIFKHARNITAEKVIIQLEKLKLEECLQCTRK